MKYPNSILVIIVLIITSCSKPDYDYSLLSPPFKRCHLSKQFVNNNLFREVVYKDDGSFEIDHILYYQNNKIREDWTEYLTYQNGQVTSNKDNDRTVTYEYNSNENLSTIRRCNNKTGNCCLSTFIYDDSNTIPIAIKTTCDDGSAFTETIEYTNFANRSYLYAYQDKSNFEYASYTKFTEQYINPFVDIYPNEIDYYQDKIIESYKDKEYILYEIDPRDVKNRFPTKIKETVLSLPSLQQIISQTNYTYEYIGCE
ncbi:MAG: hypothetical protein LC107_08995 [Chitinophagales bacterium]|nr:hypothetical protein [Chitinophagales bacterium]